MGSHVFFLGFSFRQILVSFRICKDNVVLPEMCFFLVIRLCQLLQIPPKTRVTKMLEVELLCQGWKFSVSQVVI